MRKIKTHNRVVCRSGLFTKSRSGLFTKSRSGLFTKSRSGLFAKSRSGLFTKSRSGLCALLFLLALPAFGALEEDRSAYKQAIRDLTAGGMDAFNSTRLSLKHFTRDVAWQRLTLALAANNRKLASFLLRYFNKALKRTSRTYYQVHNQPKLLANHNRFSPDST